MKVAAAWGCGGEFLEAVLLLRLGPAIAPEQPVAPAVFAPEGQEQGQLLRDRYLRDHWQPDQIGSDWSVPGQFVQGRSGPDLSALLQQALTAPEPEPLSCRSAYRQR